MESELVHFVLPRIQREFPVVSSHAAQGAVIVRRIMELISGRTVGRAVRGGDVKHVVNRVVDTLAASTHRSDASEWAALAPWVDAIRDAIAKADEGRDVRVRSGDESVFAAAMDAVAGLVAEADAFTALSSSAKREYVVNQIRQMSKGLLGPHVDVMLGAIDELADATHRLTGVRLAPVAAAAAEVATRCCAWARQTKK